MNVYDPIELHAMTNLYIQLTTFVLFRHLARVLSRLECIQCALKYVRMNITQRNGSWHADFRDIIFMMPNEKGKPFCRHRFEVTHEQQTYSISSKSYTYRPTYTYKLTSISPSLRKTF